MACSWVLELKSESYTGANYCAFYTIGRFKQFQHYLLPTISSLLVTSIAIFVILKMNDLEYRINLNMESNCSQVTKGFTLDDRKGTHSPLRQPSLSFIKSNYIDTDIDVSPNSFMSWTAYQTAHRTSQPEYLPSVLNSKLKVKIFHYWSHWNLVFVLYS